jgi:hypothetical protein
MSLLDKDPGFSELIYRRRCDDSSVAFLRPRSHVKTRLKIPRTRLYVQSFRANNEQVPAMSSYCVWGGDMLRTERKNPAGVFSDGSSGIEPMT